MHIVFVVRPRSKVPLQPGQSFKFTVLETLDRIKEEFQFLQAQYHSLKLDCEKLASEKTEMQRHYIMYYEMSYGLNIEMHKQVRQTCWMNSLNSFAHGILALQNGILFSVHTVHKSDYQDWLFISL
uniref:Groucho/TLE N-terminal Q-rich domain-containing protein n=1 Tax=Cyprinus carpio TaxID=7962 RepID=A0A8C2GJC0_CYPCA